jgi:hypothetical protein
VRNSCEPERKRKIFLEEKNGNSPERKRLLRIVVAQHPSCRAIAPTIPIPFAGTSPAPSGQNSVSVRRRCACASTENAVAVGTEPVMRVKRTKSDGLEHHTV